MSNLTSQFFLFFQSCAQFLGATTPTIMTRYNLKNILKQNGAHFKPKLPPSNILGDKRYFWEFFNGHCIEWRYLKYEGRIGSSFNRELLPIFKNLLSSEIIPDWKCEIQTITNVSCSKSCLSDFTNLNDLVRQNSQELISELTLENLAKNMNHYESKIFHETTQTVSCELWSKTFTWHNTGGSHHFAAARYIANKLDEEVELTTKLEITYIDEQKFYNLFSTYEIFLISSKNVEQYHILFETLLNSKAPFITVPIDSYFNDNKDYSSLRLLAFYRADNKSAPIVELFKNSSALDLYSYFSSLILQQSGAKEQLKKTLYPHRK
ncbi:TPA: hypothetical protein QB563_001378 [Pasteurella multocida]|uniref:DUF6685 family protein n=1 Tax=Pasteurella multocida TaxID=747 RepID=UPI0020221A6E|nr:DUF6685 family protein [Pasteurella multocida]MCL7827357.1 hypothetical protein [Pasteurella multocida]HDR1793438.1 hypothetical protein [Pasteurella multocida]HDR1868193.1 hypothetical protein [Pasteurella multocida]HED4467899.1 hypothetical protein [Pasteurella multocida]